MLDSREITCPYCGESFATTVDPSGAGAGGELRYIEDCYVCCRPIVFSVEIDDRGEPGHIRVSREDE